MTTTINNEPKGRRDWESRLVLFVFLKVSDGKTRDHLKVERKVSTKTERLKVWEGTASEDRSVRPGRGENR